MPDRGSVGSPHPSIGRTQLNQRLMLLPPLGAAIRVNIGIGVGLYNHYTDVFTKYFNPELHISL